MAAAREPKIHLTSHACQRLYWCWSGMIEMDCKTTHPTFFHAQCCRLYHIFLEDVTGQGFDEGKIRFKIDIAWQNNDGCWVDWEATSMFKACRYASEFLKMYFRH
jgi:hypothetical protein